MSAVIAGASLILVGVYFLFSYFRNTRRSQKSSNSTDDCRKVHDEFVALMAADAPDLLKKIEGKFAVVETGSGQMMPYYFGKDLTDEEFNQLMRVFNSLNKTPRM